MHMVTACGLSLKNEAKHKGNHQQQFSSFRSFRINKRMGIYIVLRDLHNLKSYIEPHQFSLALMMIEKKVKIIMKRNWD